MSENRLARLEYYYAKTFANAVKILKSVLFRDAVFRVTREGIIAKGLSLDSTQYIEVFMPRDYFNTYDLLSDSVEFSIDLDELQRALKGLRRDEKVTITVYDNAVWFSIGNASYAFYDTKPSKSQPHDIEISVKHSVKATVDTEMLHRIAKFVSESFSTYYEQALEIESKKDQQYITIRAKNAEFKMIVTDLSMSEEDTVVSYYNAEKLAEFTENIRRLSRTAILMYARESPLELLVDDRNIKVRYLQAPMII
ncbi:MAG: hypothetical protein QXH44_09230 [Pyrobaculum sp.]